MPATSLKQAAKALGVSEPMLSSWLEFPRYSGHLIACAAQADMDGVHCAQDPTRVPR
jgi:hypothetical protein